MSAPEVQPAGQEGLESQRTRERLHRYVQAVLWTDVAGNWIAEFGASKCIELADAEQAELRVVVEGLRTQLQEAEAERDSIRLVARGTLDRAMEAEDGEAEALIVMRRERDWYVAQAALRRSERDALGAQVAAVKAALDEMEPHLAEAVDGRYGATGGVVMAFHAIRAALGGLG